MDNQTKKKLKAKGQSIEPSVRIGKEGITPGLENEIAAQLKSKKLLKIKILGRVDKQDRLDVSEILTSNLNCEVVEIRGNTILLYKP